MKFDTRLYFEKSLEKIQVLLKYDKNKRYFKRTLLYTYVAGQATDENIQGHRKSWTGLKPLLLKKHLTDLHVSRLKMFRNV